jgi:hypothetical protein
MRLVPYELDTWSPITYRFHDNQETDRISPNKQSIERWHKIREMTLLAVDEEHAIKSTLEMREGLLCVGPSSRTNQRKVALLVGTVLAALAISIGTALAVTRPFAPKYTTQGPNIATSMLIVDGVGESRWVLLDWTRRFDWDSDSMSYIIVEGAPQILIFDDLINGDHRTKGHSSTEYPWDYTSGVAIHGNRTVAFEYAANTTQELDWTKPPEVVFSINGSPHDLSEGGLFLIRAANEFSVQQIAADMPYFQKRENIFEAVEEFAASNDDILAFLKETSGNKERK